MSTDQSKKPLSMADRVKQLRAQMEKMPLPLIAKSSDPEIVMLPAEDGVRLSTMFFWPKGVAAPYPTIVVRSCYPFQKEGLIYQAQAYNRRGFAFVIQWCRGIGDSEGKWEPNIYERADGLALLNELEKDARIGNIGWFGDSYLALTGWALADALPSKVKALYLGVYGCDRFCSAYQSGLFRQDILTAWAMQNAGREIDADYLMSCAYRPQIQVDQDLWDVNLPWYREWISHPDQDDPYWNEGFWGMLRDIPVRTKVALYIRDGWFDHHLGSALHTWESLPEETRRMSVLEIGPWDHGYQNVISIPGYADLENHTNDQVVLWFYNILVKEELPEGQIRLFRIGENRWESYTQYPLPERDKIRLYLSEDKLSTELSSNEINLSYLYDPNHPAPSTGGESCFHSRQAIGSIPQPPVNDRIDVISFLSEPLSQDLRYTGNIRIHLYVSSDAEDTAFSAKVMEVLPDGTAYNIRSTITTLAYQEHPEHRGLYEPGTVKKCELETWPCSWTFHTGSRIRLDISSSDFPQFAVHSNYPGIWSEQKEVRVAHQTIWCGEKYPSSIEIPIDNND